MSQLQQYEESDYEERQSPPGPEFAHGLRPEATAKNARARGQRSQDQQADDEIRDEMTLHRGPLLEPHARIDQTVGEIRQDLTDHEEQ